MIRQTEVKSFMTRFFIITAAIALALSSSALADDFRFDAIEDNTREFSVQVGYGENHKIPTRTKIRFSTSEIRLRYAKFTSPRNQTGFELCFGEQNDGADGSVYSAIITYSRYFATTQRTAWTLDAGIGGAYLSEEAPDMGTKLNFQEQIGVGFHYITGEKQALSLNYRFCHISNGGLDDENIGINASTVTLGYSWYY